MLKYEQTPNKATTDYHALQSVTFKKDCKLNKYINKQYIKFKRK